jgi:hypothetical protein
MILKAVTGFIAVLLMVAFVLPPAVKLKDLALWSVIGLGVVLMLIDLWQSLHEND